MKRNATVVVKSPRKQWTIVAVRHEWVTEFIGKELGESMTDS